MDFDKLDGLVPAIIQDAVTSKVLMLGFMNEEALEKTRSEKKVTFYSRSKKRLWTKGETSGNFFYVKEILEDCDQDTLLIKVDPKGPACHTGADTCFKETNQTNALFIDHLRAIIKDRKTNPKGTSYTNSLFNKGISKIAQKVGEEAVETVIEAMKGDKELLHQEAADLLFHYLVLLEACDTSLDDVLEVLVGRNKKK